MKANFDHEFDNYSFVRHIVYVKYGGFVYHFKDVYIQTMVISCTTLIFKDSISGWFKKQLEVYFSYNYLFFLNVKFVPFYVK